MAMLPLDKQYTAMQGLDINKLEVASKSVMSGSKHTKSILLQIFEAAKEQYEKGEISKFTALR
jgi:hypothetical protein